MVSKKIYFPGFRLKLPGIDSTIRAKSSRKSRLHLDLRVDLGAGYIIPYMFIYGPSLLMVGTWNRILAAVATACIGTLSLAGGLQGWLVKPIHLPQRAMLIAGALGLINPGIFTDLFGGLCLAAVILSVKFGYYLKDAGSA